MRFSLRKRVDHAKAIEEDAKNQYDRVVKQRKTVKQLSRIMVRHGEENHITQLILTAVRNTQ